MNGKDIRLNNQKKLNALSKPDDTNFELKIFDLNTQETVKLLSTRSEKRMDFDEVNQIF